MTMQDKAHLREWGWAGEVNSEEAEYIRGWLQQHIDKLLVSLPHLLWWERYCDRNNRVTLDNARMYAWGE